MYCMNCGATVGPGSGFCMSCGAPVSEAAPDQQPMPPAPSMPPPGPYPAAPAGPPPSPGPAYAQPPPGYAPKTGVSQGAKIAIVIVVVLAIIGVGVAAVLLSGGLGGTGACVGVSWNGSYYDYTRVYGYTEAECASWCASHSFGTNCYWEP